VKVQVLFLFVNPSDDFLNLSINEIDQEPKTCSYKSQDWQSVDEVNEIIDVYLYNCLEKGDLWKVYYTKDNEYFYKCGDKTCQSRLKIVIEQKDSPKEQNEVLTSKKVMETKDFQIPLLKIYQSSKHDNHIEDFEDLIIKKKKGKVIEVFCL